jgi:ubiquinol-cytochrome c reductase iron-sulfur subunit
MATADSVSPVQPLALARRKALAVGVGVAAAAGAAGIAGLLGASLMPSRRAREGTEIALPALDLNEAGFVEDMGTPYVILRRGPAMLAALRESAHDRRDATDAVHQSIPRGVFRSLTPEWFVANAACPRQDCVVRFAPAGDLGVLADAQGGFICPCCNSRFDAAGRAFHGSPAQDNLLVPRHQITATHLLLFRT